MLLVTLWALILFSLFHWQRDIFPYQPLLQFFLAALAVVLAFRTLQRAAKTQPFVVAFNQQGQWSYLDKNNQVQWQMTDKSRLTDWLLWVQLVSPLDPRQRHWLLVFKDQLNQEDYRSLCRAILYQQQSREL
ncbi:protein YgfX [Paraglaciecola hydrolytica]|uniref:Toxin CptA n=1 Tax=Paraglaciecola hydrolytica TaxID=1799789 RepID=A0A136A0E6_9ALTE|nr:protein YgfX [Paraglaciecola hydrolytica]KXI28684.1 hypothetical protein AX660_16560 [Paraglaciecola hydrolytica]